jgi:hypothetical protein
MPIFCGHMYQQNTIKRGNNMKQLIISAAVLALLIVPNLVFGDDLADLKAINEQQVIAWNSLDAATLASMVYPGHSLSVVRLLRVYYH